MATAIKQLCLALVMASAVCSSTLAHGKGNAGTYAANLPSASGFRLPASGCGRRIVLELFTDDSYVFVQRYLCRPWTPAQMETGSWGIEVQHLVLSSTSHQMRFSVGAAGLHYVGTRYGQEGLIFERLK